MQTSMSLQEKSPGFLPASVSVRLLLGLRLQAHAGVPVVAAQREVCGAGGVGAQPLRGPGAALHHPPQTRLPQEQLELRR